MICPECKQEKGELRAECYNCGYVSDFNRCFANSLKLAHAENRIERDRIVIENIQRFLSGKELTLPLAELNKMGFSKKLREFK